MKVKFGNTYVTLPKDTVASHMANLLTTRSIILNKERDKNFKSIFTKHKDLCLFFLRHNKKFVYSLADSEWLEDFFKFQAIQHELLMQEIVFKFSDGTEWSISLNDIASLKILNNPKDKIKKEELLKNPVDLADWAQSNLSWNQVRDFCILRKVSPNDELYQNEWMSTSKRVVQYHYEQD